MFNILSVNKSTYDPLVEKATSDQNTSEDWQKILEINDRVLVEQNGPKDCMRSIINRLYSDIPWVIMQTLTLLDSLVSNCGKRFHLEVCSRDFETEILRLIRGGKNVHPKVSERARLLLKKWAQSKDFKKDAQLNLIPSLYEKLKSEGVSFHSSEPNKRKSTIDDAMLKNPDYVANAEEEANLAKAIELSIQEAKKRGIKTDIIPVTSAVTSSTATSSSTNNNNTNNNQQMSGSQQSSTTNSLYPSFNLSEVNNLSPTTNQLVSKSSSDVKDPMKVRALYDFEAAEDNELTFKAGEIILVSDSSDANWWKGSNHRGEGLFPANFVSTDLNAEPESSYKTSDTKKVQFNDEVKVVKVEKEEIKPEDITVDEEKIDQLMSMLQEADPKSFDDPGELLRLEEQCLAMMPLIDQQMESIDKRNAMLTSLNHQLNSALNLYHDLMKESLLIEQMTSLQIQQPQQYPEHQHPISGSYPQQYPMVNGGLLYDPNQQHSTQPLDAQQGNFYPQQLQHQPLTIPAGAVSYGHTPIGTTPSQNMYQSPTHQHHGSYPATVIPPQHQTYDQQQQMMVAPMSSPPSGVSQTMITAVTMPNTTTPAVVPNLL